MSNKTSDNEETMQKQQQDVEQPSQSKNRKKLRLRLPQRLATKVSDESPSRSTGLFSSPSASTGKHQASHHKEVTSHTFVPWSAPAQVLCHNGNMARPLLPDPEASDAHELHRADYHPAFIQPEGSRRWRPWEDDIRRNNEPPKSDRLASSLHLQDVGGLLAEEPHQTNPSEQHNKLQQDF